MPFPPPRPAPDPQVALLTAELQRQAAYVELAERLARAPDVAGIYRVVSDFIPRVLGVPRASLALLGKGASSGKFTVVALGGAGGVLDTGVWFPAEATALSLACRERRSITTLEFAVDRFPDWRNLHAEKGLCHFIVSPLRASSGAVLGTFNIGMPGPNPVTPDEVARARSFAQVVASNLELRELSETLSASLQTLQSTQEQLIQSEKVAALGDLLAGFAHEINTPLGVALTAATLMGNELQTARDVLNGPRVSRRELLQALDRASESTELVFANLQRGAALLQELKERASSDRRSIIETLDLATLCAGVVDSMAPFLSEHGCTVRLSVTPLTLRTDAGALRSILINLIQNACIHGYSGPPSGEPCEVHVTLEPVASAARQEARLTVRDHGRGIPQDIADRVFEPFFTTRRGQGGTGLGLHFAHAAARAALRGRLELVPVDRGTAFVCRFPSLADGRLPTGGQP